MNIFVYIYIFTTIYYVLWPSPEMEHEFMIWCLGWLHCRYSFNGYIIDTIDYRPTITSHGSNRQFSYILLHHRLLTWHDSHNGLTHAKISPSRMSCWFHGLLPWQHWLFGCLEAGGHLRATGGARHPSVTETWRSVGRLVRFFAGGEHGKSPTNGGRKMIFPFWRVFLRILSDVLSVFVF